MLLQCGEYCTVVLVKSCSNGARVFENPNLLIFGDRYKVRAPVMVQVGAACGQEGHYGGGSGVLPTYKCIEIQYQGSFWVIPQKSMWKTNKHQLCCFMSNFMSSFM